MVIFKMDLLKFDDANVNITQWLSSGRPFHCHSFHTVLSPDVSHVLSIQQVHISTAKSGIFSTINSAGQLIKMAVI